MNSSSATLSDDEEILEVAKEIIDSPEIAKMQREIDAERASKHRAHIESAKKRLKKAVRFSATKWSTFPVKRS